MQEKKQEQVGGTQFHNVTELAAVQLQLMKAGYGPSETDSKYKCRRNVIACLYLEQQAKHNIINKSSAKQTDDFMSTGVRQREPGHVWNASLLYAKVSIIKVNIVKRSVVPVLYYIQVSYSS